MSFLQTMPPYRLTLTTGQDALYHAVPCGSAVKLQRIAITGPASGWKVNFYSRYFTGSAISIARITSYAGGTKIKVELGARHDFKVSDTITLASTGVGAYNGANRLVSEVIDNNTVVLSVAYVSEVQGVGTAQLVIPSAEFPNYEVGAQQTAASSKVDYLPGIPYQNQDAQTNIGDQRKIYLKFDTIGTYVITIANETSY